MAEGHRNSRWRQGQLLSKEAIEALGLFPVTDAKDTLAIVASHDCDLASGSDREPFVEVIVGLKVIKDGNHTHGKNPRKLHIEFSGETSFWGEFEASSKRSIDKHSLMLHSPLNHSRLNAENQATFQFWLASRYRRAAFPDEFERRLKANKLTENIATILKPLGSLITGLFFSVDSDEEMTHSGKKNTFILDITLLYIEDDSLIEGEKIANALAQSLTSVFRKKLFDPEKNQWQDIELRSCEAVSEAALSYQDFKIMKRWRLDYISLGADPQQPAPAE